MKRLLSKTAILFSTLVIPFAACSSIEDSKVSHEDKKVELPKWKQEVKELEDEIDHLTNQRNLALAKATSYQNQGDRLQFNRNNLLDARLAWQQAELNREIAARIQQEIDILEEKRAKILKSHGVKNPPRKSET
jgi:hypothetical protein